jgi:hypothetical protein
MEVSYRLGGVDALGATSRTRAASLETEHRRAVVRGQKPQTAASNMAGTDSAVGSSWG